MLYLQTARYRCCLIHACISLAIHYWCRYLHKLFNKCLSQSQLPLNITYLATDYHKNTVCVAKTAEQFSDPDLLVEAYCHRVRKMVEIASAQYQEASKAGMDEVEAWNEASVDWINAVKVC